MQPFTVTYRARAVQWQPVAGTARVAAPGLCYDASPHDRRTISLSAFPILEYSTR